MCFCDLVDSNTLDRPHACMLSHMLACCQLCQIWKNCQRCFRGQKYITWYSAPPTRESVENNPLPLVQLSITGVDRRYKGDLPTAAALGRRDICLLYTSDAADE